jgi:Flp pilus assembly protein TadD
MLVKLDRTEEAAERLKAKLDYFENNPDVRVALGRIHMLEGRYDKAVRWFQEASLLSSGDDAIAEHLAMAEFAAGKYGDAIERLRRLLAKEGYKDRDDLRMALGDAYMATGEPVRARAAFLEVTRNEEGDVNAWIKLAQAAWAVEDMIRLRKASERIRELAPDRHEGYVVQGLIDREAGRTEAAIRQFERAAELAPSEALPLLMKGMALEDTGDAEAARQAYQRAQELAPNDPRPGQLLSALNAS